MALLLVPEPQFVAILAKVSTCLMCPLLPSIAHNCTVLLRIAHNYPVLPCSPIIVASGTMKIECIYAYPQNILGLRKLITTMMMMIMLVISVTTLRVNLDNFGDAEVDDGR